MFKLQLMSSASSIRRDERGNVAIIFGLMAIPMLGMVGAAVDFSRAVHLQYKLQQVADGAALTGIRTYKTTGSTADGETQMLAYIDSALEEAGMTRALNQADIGKASLNEQPVYVNNTQIDPSDSSVKPTLETKIMTPFLSWFGQEMIDVSTTTEVVASARTVEGTKNLELSMMLDVSGSMQGDKIEDMKEAAQDFLDIVMPDDLARNNRRVGLVPFTDRVNLGTYASAAMGIPATRQVQSGTITTYVFSTTSFGWRTLSDCGTRVRQITAFANYSTAQAQAHCTANFTTRRSGNTTQYNTPNRVTVNTPNYVTHYLRPCATERQGFDAYSEAAPAAGSFVGWHTPTSGESSQYNSGGTCSTSAIPVIKPLTTDKQSLKTHIAAFQALSTTAGHVATAWSWYMLSPEWNNFWCSNGYTIAPYSDTETIKAAVLMSDGEFNGNIGVTSASAQALEICQNMKDAGIIVYTIGFDMSTNVNDPARQTLQQCASPNKYYFPYNGTQLREAFNQIGSQLVNIVHTNSEDVEVVITE